MSEIAEKTAEVVAENVEEAIDGTVEVLEVVRNNPVVLAVVGVLGLAAGGAGGYFIAKKKLQRVYEDLATEEIAQAKEFYANLNKVDEDGAILTPQDVMERRHGSVEAAKAVRVYRGERHPEADEEGLVEVEPGILVNVEDETLLAKTEAKVNVFKDDTFDLEEEMKYRTEEKPYIITHDEFFGAEKDYDNASLTYYEVDMVLTDERDQPIEDTNSVVGDDHLQRFGSGSRDKKIVYVRNDKLQMDYEIAKSTGSYLEEVLGMTEEPGELKHSATRERRRAFRHGED